ncbi:hypothetical protein [Natrarchaeobius oligotrophus]|uniref:Uncharacterized protein n=1 Tax=Natrarchaeobius chitinivorans TaxID=1679083 RepID=A0A3N6P639_NATCH|nr:hypothetical protein [Natrarchaeobius chitinivorans]RQG93739.1 hypothetical protein EA472_22665 [Natrarchaeobius chitinivorans]
MRPSIEQLLETVAQLTNLNDRVMVDTAVTESSVTVTDGEVTDPENAAVLEKNSGSTELTVMGRSDGGGMDITIECSHDGENWFERVDLEIDNISTGDTEATGFQSGSEFIRAWSDANVGMIVLSGKGI